MSTTPTASSPGNDPCGIDLVELGKLQELERFATPVAATTNDGKRIFGDDTRKEPDWTKVEAMSTALLQESHDLRVVGFYTAARLRNDGLSGLAQGLSLMWQMLERWGLKAHPIVDTKNSTSVLERLLALVSVAAPYKRDGDLLRIVEGVRKTSLTSKSSSEFNYARILAGRKVDGTEDSQTIEAFRQAWSHESEEQQLKTLGFIDSSLESLASITNWIKITLPDHMVPSDPTMSSVGPLVSELQGIKNAIYSLGMNTADTVSNVGAITEDQHRQSNSVTKFDPSAPEGSSITTPASVSALSAPITQGIRNREDAVRLLLQVRDYFKVNEPTSPAIFYIERARGLVGKSFMDVLTELMPDAASKFQELVGIAQNQDEKSKK